MRHCFFAFQLHRHTGSHRRMSPYRRIDRTRPGDVTIGDGMIDSFDLSGLQLLDQIILTDQGFSPPPLSPSCLCLAGERCLHEELIPVLSSNEATH